MIVEKGDWLFSKYSHSLPYTTFYAKVSEIKTATGWVKATGTIKFYISEAVKDVNTGDEIQAFCRLEKFSAPDNPGQFNTAEYMHRNGVYLSASVKTKDVVTILKTEKLKSPFDTIREKLRRFATIGLTEDIESDDSAALIEALLLGNRIKISRELYDAFITTGLAHLISLSGLHVGIIAAFAWWAAKKAGLLHRGRSTAAVFTVILFLLIVPARTPTLRAGIMFTIIYFGHMFSRRAKTLNSLALAAIFILLIRPTDFLSPGFQLSFAAVLGIVLFCPLVFGFLIRPFEHLNKTLFYPILRILLGGLSTGLTAWLATAPILAWHFYRFQPLTALWTMPTVFLVAAILILGMFKIILACLLPSLAFFIGKATTFLADVFSWLVIHFARVPFSQVLIGKPHIAVILAFYLLILLWRFLPFRRPAKNLVYPGAIILMLISALSVRYFKNLNSLRLTVLSVGHGQATVVQLPDRENIIIDAGSMSRNDIGRRIVNPFLNYIAADKIDSVFISHDDIDHYNGLPEILNKHKCKNVYTTRQFIQNAATSRTDAELSDSVRSKNLSLCVAPEKISLGKTVITRLWPKETLTETPLSDNESSLVLLIEYAGRKILLCSDITAEVQRQLMDLYPQLGVDLIVTPHHGSGRTLEPLFLNAFKPEFLITSCSQARLAGVGEKTKEFGQSFLTCKDGAITVFVTPTSQIKIKTFK